MLFDILVVGGSAGRIGVRAGGRFGIWELGLESGGSRPMRFEKDLIKDASFGESRLTKKRGMNQGLRRGVWVELGLP